MDAQELRRFSPLNALSAQNLRDVSTHTVIKDIPASSFIFKRGDTDNRHVYVLEGEVDLSTDSKVVRSVAGGSPESLQPLAHIKPRTVTARAKSACKILTIDSDHLDLMLTWDQTSTYNVEELYSEDEEPGETDWMTKILKTTAFHRIPPANIQQMFMRMEQINVSEGEIVVSQGEMGQYYYMVKEGRCAVIRTTTARPEGIKLAELSVGDSFGEEALISETKRNASVKMLTNGSMMRLSKDDFMTLLNEPLLSWTDFNQAIQMVATEKAIWLDVRLPSEFEQRHVRNSINIPLIFLRMKANTLDKERKYLIYCDTTRRSSAAAFILNERGFNAYILKEGMGSIPETAWVSKD